jgi:hypothetical protein
MMVVILQLIRFGLIGLSLYMLYVAVQESDWLMLSALVLNLVYLIAIPRLSRLIKRWFDARNYKLASTERGHEPERAYRDERWPLLEVTNTALGQGSDVVASQDDNGHRLALRVTFREVTPWPSYCYGSDTRSRMDEGESKWFGALDCKPIRPSTGTAFAHHSNRVT